MGLIKAMFTFGFYGLVLTMFVVFLWVLLNFEMPEAEMQPLTILARSNATHLRAIGVVFPQDGVDVELSPGQIKRLALILIPRGPQPKLTNRGGHPYLVYVSRRPDKTAPSGYHYDWQFYSVGRDGVRGNEDDVGIGMVNRP